MRFILALTVFLSLLQSHTALQVVVIDAVGQPVMGLRIDVETEDGTSHQLHTDSNGFSPITPLEGNQFSVTRVTQPDGSELTIETTTLDRLQLALLPGQTRTILFRVSNGVFAVDPETLFAGADTPPTVATMQAALPKAASTESVRATAETLTEQAAQPTPVEAVPEQAATPTPIQEDLSEHPTPVQEQAEPTPQQEDGRSLVRVLTISLVVLAGAVWGAIWYRIRKRGQQ